MIIKFDHVFLIMSKDGQLMARGVPRDRYICHINEKTNKRLLTYSSKSKATSAFRDCGFFLSNDAEKYIAENYLEIKKIYWTNELQELFEAKEFVVTYESVE
jgi:hypothetical protein